MLEHLIDRVAFATDVARDLILCIDFENDLAGLLHEAILAARALLIVPLATKLAKKLAALWVLALHRLVYNFLADTAEEVLVEHVNGR